MTRYVPLSLVIACAAVVVGLTAAPLKLLAEAPGATSSADTTAAPLAKVESSGGEVMGAIRSAVAADSSDLTKNERDAIRTFYAVDTAQPIFITDSGLTAKGNAVIAVVGEADAWGLVASDYALPTDQSTAASQTDDVATLAQIERHIAIAALQYARHARGGRVRPQSISSRFDQSPPKTDAGAILQALAQREDARHYLEAKHPRHPQFVKLKQKLAELRAPKSPEAQLTDAQKTKVPDGPTLRLGSSHAHVALLRTRLEIAAISEPDENGANAAEAFDDAVKDAVIAFQTRRGVLTDGIVGPGTRRALNSEFENPDLKRNRTEQLLLINMERWRWLPQNLGAFHVWNNVPEFQTHVISENKQIFSERIIVGKPSQSTPAFSADMKYVIFQPSWGVPNGIKQNEILPYLRQQSGFFGFGGSDTRILKRHNLTVSRNGRPVDASKIDWSKADIRSYQFTQPPGSRNVLGNVKFRFPNHHDVYMHDTPERHLFTQSVRAYSHGCLRVNNPKRLAEVLLAHDKGWSADKVDALWRGRGNGYVTLDTEIPVHTTYMTAIVDGDGRLQTFKDLYGYDGRTAQAIGLKPEVFERQLISRSAPSRPRPKKQRQQPQYSAPETFAEALSGLFAN